MALGSCCKLKSLNFTRGFPETLGNLPPYVPVLLAITMVTISIDAHNYTETEENNKTNKRPGANFNRYQNTRGAMVP